MFLQPPFPETETEILEATFTVIHFVILFFFIILMIYLYQKILSVLPLITVYMFSLIIGFNSMLHLHLPFSPLFELFFLVFQTSIFIISSLEIKNK